VSATAAPRVPTLPPGPSLPPFAQTIAFIRSPERFMTRTRDEFGDVFTVRVLGAPPLVVIADPAAIRDVFTGPADVMLAGQANATLEPLVGPRSVLLLDREEHLAERRRLLPPFHGQRLAGYETIIERATQREMEGWRLNRAFPLLPSMQEITLEVIMRAVSASRRASATSCWPSASATRSRRPAAAASRRSSASPSRRRRSSASSPSASARSTRSSTPSSPTAAPTRAWPSARTSCRCSCRRA
jgi:cytochrome P450